MRYSQAFIPTLKEVPKEATTPSHVLLLRGGFVRMVGAGIYEMLPLGLRVMTKIAAIVREEMDRAGAQEVLMPALLPKEYFEESGRWDSFGDTLLRLKDRKAGEYHLGPTHEEIITDMVRRDVKSYRQLPLNLYQIQMKFRDEARPRAGLLRCREFLMKDAYSFDTSEQNAIASYEAMREAYHRIFRRLGLDYRIVAADSGAMGGSTSAEFQVLAQNGEDSIVACTKCDYAANVEVAAQVAPAKKSDAVAAREKVATPGKKTIEDVAKFLGLPASRTMKTLMVVADGKLTMVLVRGDHEGNDVKIARAAGAREVRMASDVEIREGVGPVGYLGPVGWSGPVIADLSLDTGEGFVSGGNEVDVHLRDVVLGRDFQAKVADVRTVGNGDSCPRCGGELKSYRGIEGGHIFVLGTHYSAKMRATFLDENNVEKPIVMGCYGIGVSRLVATSIEQHHDENGIKWPIAIAPYHVVVTTAGKGDDLDQAAVRIYDELRAKGVEVLFDDRDERPGVKFKDADLIGIPLRVVIGKKGLAEGKAEVKARDEKDPTMVPLAEVAASIEQRIVAGGGRLRAG
ncbi:proline--tRNA ligase [Sandaracinus amylolyticus]|uniref:proline--tRNA ligase n=1 Tax=Sandaracinus amylolyticus TaxID=927083 RepID=UPI001F02DA47|nr:proline--tRNA ligase [Sandaracinus amylolyticus]UJR81856.1 Prolyl-tRNA synthetase [Sandaracinus amylolyticus]